MTPETSCQIPPVTTSSHPNIVQYVRERRCPSGGYCFYRLDEPNAGDTFHALQVLSLLGEKVRDEETVTFLQGLQQPDGAYHSLSAALFAGEGLRFLGEHPLFDMSTYLASNPPRLNPDTLVVETFSLFDPLFTWITLHSLNRIPLTSANTLRIIHSVLQFQTGQGGFGSPVPTLRDTWQASEILVTLGYPQESLGISRFVWSCEDPEFGYLGKPGSRPPYLEHLYAGVRLSVLLGTGPRYAGACRAFIDKCAHHSGGFVRSVFGGSPTLEFTALAVESLAILEGRTHRLRTSCG